ncbi:MAG: winged helix-turn-helix transcriptional regulator [Arenibacterium sp.]
MLRRNWSLPVLWTSRRPSYFGDIRANLPAITDRALSNALKQLESHQWVRRRIEPESRPPRARYQAINTGQKICAVIARTQIG